MGNAVAKALPQLPNELQEGVGKSEGPIQRDTALHAPRPSLVCLWYEVIG